MNNTGNLSYIWRGPQSARMRMRRVDLKIVPAERIVCTQLFDAPATEARQAWLRDTTCSLGC